MKIFSEEIKDIPSSVFTAFVDDEEIGIISLSPYMIKLRCPEKIKEKSVIKIAWYNFKTDEYNELVLNDYIVKNITKEEFYDIYIIEILNDIEYEGAVRKFTKQYYKYIMLKCESIGNEFSKELVDYPNEKDEIFSENYETWKNKQFSNEKINGIKNKLIELSAQDIEIAYSINDNKLYNAYIGGKINSDSLMIVCNRIYIGNAFCPNLMPDLRKIIDILDYSLLNNKEITFVFSFIYNDRIEYIKKYCDTIYKWCLKNSKKIEIEINDWGYITLLKCYEDYFEIILGTFLNKRRKDTRMKYKNGIKNKKNLLMDNQLNNECFQEMLKNENIKRCEYEICGYKMNIMPGKHSLHIPFYQTNTSKYCTLYAVANNLDRKKQIQPDKCPMYCQKYAFIYSDHLNMTGRFNSLFGIDQEILHNYKILDDYIKNGINRIVWDEI